MKRLLFLIALTIPISAWSANVNLAWDASTSPEVQGYAIYHRDYQHPYDYSTPLWQGNALTCTVTVPDDRQTAFVARAWGYGPYDLEGNREVIWSDNSNQVTFTPPVVKPEPPRNFIVRILVAVLNFFRGWFA